MEGLLQLLLRPSMDKVGTFPEKCTAVHECCSKRMSLKNQEGTLCTLFGTRYIFTSIDGIPHLLPLFPSHNMIKWASVLSTVIWQKLSLQYHKRIGDGTVVNFDAVRVNRTSLYQILCMWIDNKPKGFHLPTGQQFLVLQTYSAVPCTYSGSDQNLVSVKINGQTVVFKKPGAIFKNGEFNAAFQGHSFNGYLLEVLQNSADSPQINNSEYKHSLILHAIYEGNLPLPLANIKPMTMYVQNGSEVFEPSQGEYMLFLDATAFREDDNFMCTVNGTKMTAANALRFYHFCPHKKYPAYVMKYPTGFYTAYALQDCLCCECNKVNCNETASYAPESYPNCLSSHDRFCRGSAMSRDSTKTAFLQSNGDTEMSQTVVDTTYGPLKFEPPVDLETTVKGSSKGSSNLEFNGSKENKRVMDNSRVADRENCTPSSVSSSQDELDQNYYEEQTRREKHLSLHPEWVSRSETPEKVFTAQEDLHSKVELEVPIIEKDSKLFQSTAKNLQYIMKFNESNEEILDDPHVVQCLDNIYEELSSSCVIPSTSESFPICFGGQDVFVLQNCSEFKGCRVGSSITVIARNERYALLKVPFEKLYIVCPLDKLPHLPMETKTNILYSRESFSKILGAEVCVGFLSWSADRSPVLCRHWCAKHGLQMKPVNDLSYITVFSGNNRGKHLDDCPFGTNHYPPFSESTLSSLAFKIVPADIIAFEKGLLHLALDTSSPKLVTCSAQAVFLTNVKSHVNDMLQNRVFDTKVNVVMHSSKVVFVYDELTRRDCLHMCEDHHPVVILRRCEEFSVTGRPFILDPCSSNDSTSGTNMSTLKAEKLTIALESNEQFMEKERSNEGVPFQKSEKEIGTFSPSLDVLIDDTFLQQSSATKSNKNKLPEQSNSVTGLLSDSSTSLSSLMSSTVDIKSAPENHLNYYQPDENFAAGVSKLPVPLHDYVAPLMKKNLRQNCALLSASNRVILLPLANIHDKTSVMEKVDAHPKKKFSMNLLCAKLEPPILFDQLTVNLVSVLAHAGPRPPCSREIRAFWGIQDNVVSRLAAYEMLYLSTAMQTTKLSVLGKILVLGEEYGILKFSVVLNGTVYYAKFSIKDLKVLKNLSSKQPYFQEHSIKACLYSCCHAVVEQDKSKHPISECGFNATHVFSGSVEDLLKDVAQNSSNFENWSLQLNHFMSLSSTDSLKRVGDWNEASSVDYIQQNLDEHIDHLLRMERHPTLTTPLHDMNSLEQVDSVTDSRSSVEATCFRVHEETIQVAELSHTEITSPPCAKMMLPPNSVNTSVPNTEISSSILASTTTLDTQNILSLSSEITLPYCAAAISSHPKKRIPPLMEMTSSPGTENTVTIIKEMTTSPNTGMTLLPNVAMISSANTEMTWSTETKMTSSPITGLDCTECTTLSSIPSSKSNPFFTQFTCHVVKMKSHYAVLHNGDKYVLLPYDNIFDTCFLTGPPSKQAIEQLLKNDIHVVCLQTKEYIKVAKLLVNHFALFAYMTDAPQILPDLLAQWKSFDAISKNDVIELLSASRNPTVCGHSQSVYGNIIAAADETALFKFQDDVSGKQQFAKVRMESMSFLPSAKPYLTISNVNLCSFVESHCVASVEYRNQFLFPCYEATEALVGNIDEVHKYLAQKNFTSACKPRTFLSYGSDSSQSIEGIAPSPTLSPFPDIREQIPAIRANRDVEGTQSSKKILNIRCDAEKEIVEHSCKSENDISSSRHDISEYSTGTIEHPHLQQSLVRCITTSMQATFASDHVYEPAFTPEAALNAGVTQATTAPDHVYKTAFAPDVAFTAGVTKPTAATDQVKETAFTPDVALTAGVSRATAFPDQLCETAFTPGVTQTAAAFNQVYETTLTPVVALSTGITQTTVATSQVNKSAFTHDVGISMGVTQATVASSQVNKSAFTPDAGLSTGVTQTAVAISQVNKTLVIPSSRGIFGVVQAKLDATPAANHLHKAVVGSDASRLITVTQASDTTSQVHKTTLTPPLKVTAGFTEAAVAPSKTNKTIFSASGRSSAVTPATLVACPVNKTALVSAVPRCAGFSGQTAKSCHVARVVSDSIMSSIENVSSKKLQIPPVTNNILNKVHHYCASVRHFCKDYAILYANQHYIFFPYNKLYSTTNRDPAEIIKNSENGPSIFCVSLESRFCLYNSFVDGFCFAAFYGKKPSGLETVKKVIEFSNPKTLHQSINCCIRDYLESEEGMANSSFEDHPNNTKIETKIFERSSGSTGDENLLTSKSSEDFAAKNHMTTKHQNQFKEEKQYPSPNNFWTATPNKVTTRGVSSTPTENHSRIQNKKEVKNVWTGRPKSEVETGNMVMAQDEAFNSSASITSKIGMNNARQNQWPSLKKPANLTYAVKHQTENAKLKLTLALKSINNGSLKLSCSINGANHPSTSLAAPRATSAEGVLSSNTQALQSPLQISTFLHGKISDTHPDLGELETSDGKKLIFQPKQCFLFGVSLQGLELWHVLVKDLAVEYEVNNDAGTQSIRAVYVGGWNSGQLNNSEVKRNLIDWCLDKCVPDEARNTLVDRVAKSSMRHEIWPQIADNDDREVVIIGPDDSDEFDVELN